MASILGFNTRSQFAFRRSRSAHLLALIALGLALLSLTARAGDDLLIYAERSALSYGTPTFHNGWQDNGWGPRYSTNSPTHTGTNAYCLAPSGGWQAIKFVHGDINASLYDSLTLWINGGATGGQSVGVSALLNGVEQPRVSIGIGNRLPTNSWLQVTLSLSTLGVAGKTNFDGLMIWSTSGSTQAPFYVDDISLTAKALPAVVSVNVNATQEVRTVDARIFGVNTAAWDSDLDTASTLSVLRDMDNQVLRWPGGSWGDSYFMTNELRYWGSRTTNFLHVATNTAAQVYFIVNYGSGTAQQAADWVRCCNVTNRAAVKYWEVGNEVGGSWETDYNTNAPYYAHDPWSYAVRFKDYYTRMKAVDPTIKIGAVADLGENNLNHVNGRSLAAYPYTNHPAINPRTGTTNYGWTPVMLTTLRSNGITPDFLIEHNYAPNNGDAWNLFWSKNWSTDAADLRQMISDYLGTNGTNVELAVTEHGAGGDRQRVSLVGGLFWVDSIGQILKTEFNTLLWWDLRNGQAAIANSDYALYGWRRNWFTNTTLLTNTLEFYYDEGIVTGSAAPTNRYPAFYCAKLLKNFARGGDRVLSVTTGSPWMAAYSVRRQSGALALLVLNKSSAATIVGDFTLTGFAPATNATVWSYGIPQDEAARTGIGTTDITQTNAINIAVRFNRAFAPYSATVLLVPPAPARLLALPSAPLLQVVQIQSQTGARWVIQSSTNLLTWANLSTNTMPGATLNVTNVAAGERRFLRALWLP